MANTSNLSRPLRGSKLPLNGQSLMSNNFNPLKEENKSKSPAERVYCFIKGLQLELDEMDFDGEDPRFAAAGVVC